MEKGSERERGTQEGHRGVSSSSKLAFQLLLALDGAVARTRCILQRFADRKGDRFARGSRLPSHKNVIPPRQSPNIYLYFRLL